MKHWHDWERMQEELPGMQVQHFDTMLHFSHGYLELPPYYERKACLTAVFLEELDGKAYDVTLRFIGVRSLKLDMYFEYLRDIEISPEEIEDIHFYVHDYEHDGISFYCEEIAYIGAQENVEENLQLALSCWTQLVQMEGPGEDALGKAFEDLAVFANQPMVADLLRKSVTHENAMIRRLGNQYLAENRK
ncbi:hypothetical protein HB847_10405 [Listeria booriae]|uniref:Uncharacterized protein n=1 Tax=Listeria booriae TaxID=1552123 RepID=A0A841Y436_9LIST|nr:hypothetical protein [Listeria booriae]MBC1372776.1 hypothetical protein [Listeria booriae]